MNRVFRQALGTASAKPWTSPLAISGVSIADGATVLAWILRAPGVSISSVVCGAQAMTLVSDASTTLDGAAFLLACYKLESAATVTGGAITATASASGACAVMLATAYHRVAPAALDDAAVANDSGTAVVSGEATASTAIAFIAGVVSVNGPTGDGTIEAGPSYTAGATVGTTGDAATTNATLAEFYKTVVETGAYSFTATLPVNRAWAAAVAIVKASEGTALDEVVVLAGRDVEEVLA